MNNWVCSQLTCRRCGLCEAVCPSGAIHGVPGQAAAIGDGCVDCELCRQLCPAIGVYRDSLLPADILPGAHDGPLGPVGIVKVGRLPESSDLVASGGAVTAILRHLLASNEVDCVVGVGMDEGMSSRPVSKVIRTPDDLHRIAGSCYQVVDHARIIPRLSRISERIAFVGLPCHIQALRAYQKSGMTTNVVLTIGIFCGFNLLPEATDFLLTKLQRGDERPFKIEYRGGPWPGGFRVQWDSGRTSFLPKDDYSLCDALFMPEFCGYCVDLTSELSDLSFGDAWYRPGGWSTILVRTATGSRALEGAVAGGTLEIGDASAGEVQRTQAHTIALKKVRSVRRLASLPETLRPKITGYNLDEIDHRRSAVLDFAAARSSKSVVRAVFSQLPIQCFAFSSRLARWITVRLLR